MSGFGIRALKKVKEEAQAREKRSFFKHIVLGENSAALLTFFKLQKKFPGEVKLITKNPYYKEDLLTEWDCSLGDIRNQTVADGLIASSSQYEIFSRKRDVFFYKDAKFHKFGGRAKPHDLKDNEVFFAHDFFEIKKEAFFSAEEFEGLDNIIKENQFNKIVEKIEVTKPEDLVDVANFKLYTGEYECFDCEKLYYCESPKSFFSLVSNKDELSDIIHKYCAGVENHAGIAVSFSANKMVYDKSGTVIIPQSLTHDWGSFVCDFSEFDESTSTQTVRALTYIGEHEVQEDDLAKKIKLMRRVIERVFPEFAKADTEQSIRYSEEYTMTGLDDSLHAELKEQSVLFVGHGGPISIESSELFQYDARTFIGLADI